MQTSRYRVERLSRMGGASGCGLYVPWGGVCGARTARDCDSGGRVAASARPDGSGQGGTGEITATDALGAESGADDAAGAVAPSESSEPAAEEETSETT